MKKVGFVGLGNMGARMVTNLLKANYEVIGYDINEEFVKQLLPKGLKKASNLNDISKDIDIIITMLPKPTKPTFYNLILHYLENQIVGSFYL